MKKSASTILCSGLFVSALSGCALPLETPKNESAYRTAITQLEPVTVPSEIYKAFNEHGQQLLLKDFSDLSNQLKLFISEDDDLGIRPEEYIRELGGDRAFLQKHSEVFIRSIKAFEKSTSLDDWQELMKLFLVIR